MTIACFYLNVLLSWYNITDARTFYIFPIPNFTWMFDDAMSLEASDSLIDYIWVSWRNTSNTAYLCDIMGKWKVFSQDIKKRIVDLHKSGSSFGSISRCLKVPRSSVQTIMHKYKHHANIQLSSGRRQILCPRDKYALVRNVHINPRTKAKHLSDDASIIIHCDI